MTQQAVERAVGKLVTDEAFRERFFVDPIAVCVEAGLTLSPVELEALSRLSPRQLAEFAESVDARITRACLDPTLAAKTAAVASEEDA